MHSEMMGEIGKHREQLDTAILEYSKCTIHVKVGTGWPRSVVLRKSEPLWPNSYLLLAPVMICPGCFERFKVGDTITLFPVGPGLDPEERAKCDAGRAYDAIAFPIHWACATGEQ